MHFGIMEGLVTWLPPSVDVVAKTSNVKTNKKTGRSENCILLASPVGVLISRPTLEL